MAGGAGTERARKTREMMDYEKKYNEALSQARFYYGNCPTEPEKKKLEKLFPELRESEEEKRMRAIAVLEQQRHFWSYEGPADKTPPATKRKDLVEAIDVALSYLEKQKETPMPNSTELIEMWHKAKAILKEKDFRGDEWRLAQNAFMDGFARGTCVKFEKQEEQKPAGWSEEDENIINNICNYLLGVLRLSDVAKEKAIVFLNSLRPPKGWKEGWCEDCKVRYNHWKPSEEQMKALKQVVFYGDSWVSKIQQVLGTLYEQLKELM